MKFKFTGDPKDGEDGYRANNPSHVVLHGVRFVYDQPVDVADEALSKKLMGNAHFQCVEEQSEVEPDAVSEPEETAQPEIVEEASEDEPVAKPAKKRGRPKASK